MEPPVILSPMQDPESFDLPDVLHFLAAQLSHGRLALVLGAGVSIGFGLPNWHNLVSAVAIEAGKAVAASLSDTEASELLRTNFGNDISFAEAVRKVLYREFSISLQDLSSNRLLAAIGALTMSSMRGRVGRVISFNFDDILERYLTYHGLVIKSAATAPCWDNRADITILHPHGLLPSDLTKPVSSIVLTQMDFDRIVGDVKNAWHRKLIDIMASNTCIFLGLSGKDPNLLSLLLEAKANHVSLESRDAYWGVRLSVTDDEMVPIWKNRGVAPIPIDSYGDIPSLLFDICQRAAVMGNLWLGP